MHVDPRFVYRGILVIWLIGSISVYFGACLCLIVRPHYNVDWFKLFGMRRSLSIIYRFGHNRLKLGARGESRGVLMIRVLPGIKGYPDVNYWSLGILRLGYIEAFGVWSLGILKR